VNNEPLLYFNDDGPQAVTFPVYEISMRHPYGTMPTMGEVLDAARAMNCPDPMLFRLATGYFL
jgi:hypothetical protein